MPFKSESQKRRFRTLVASGEMTQAEFDKWEADTPKGKLPERVGEKKGRDFNSEIKGRFNK